jgi:hypothetical protein
VRPRSLVSITANFLAALSWRWIKYDMPKRL